MGRGGGSSSSSIGGGGGGGVGGGRRLLHAMPAVDPTTTTTVAATADNDAHATPLRASTATKTAAPAVSGTTILKQAERKAWFYICWWEHLKGDAGTVLFPP